MKQIKNSRRLLLYAFMILSFILGPILSSITGIIKLNGPIDVWYWITLISTTFFGFFLGYYLEKILAPARLKKWFPPIWRLKNNVMHVGELIRKSVDKGEITKNDSEKIKNRLMALREKTTRESLGDSILAILFAPYFIVYSLFADRRITDCAFNFTLTRFFRQKKRGLSLRSVRELTDNVLQSLEWYRRRSVIEQLVSYGALFAALAGIGLHQGIIDFEVLLRYIFANVGMSFAMIFIDYNGPF